MSAETCNRCGKPRRFIGLPRCECDEVGARCAVSTGSERREIVRKRISELAAKEALGEATASDIKKLDRYQQLRRDGYQLEPEQQHQAATYDWKCRLMLKQMKALLRASQNMEIGDAPTSGDSL